MEFVKTTSRDKAEAALLQRLQASLKKGKRVLWLLSGGSNIALTVAVMEQLETSLTKDLTIFLMDERYGDVGHLNSNAKQLYDSGFTPKEGVFIPTLMPGFTLEETAERFAAAAQRAFEHADEVIAQMGIGSDGHIAGILPHSPAVEATGWVTSYHTETYTRVSLTFDALRLVTVTYAMAFGDEKQATLERLRDEDLSLAEQPAQLLKTLPEVYIYNDHLGGTA